MPATPHPAARHFIVAFCAALLTFLLLDAGWLTAMSARLYRPAIGPILRTDFDGFAAAMFYLLYIAGLVFFVIAPAQDGRRVIRRGAFFGLVCYGAYDLTNQATIVGWSWRVTLADLAWGALVTAISAWVAQRAARKWRW